MKPEILETIKGVSNPIISNKLNISEESLQSALNGTADNEFLERFDISDDDFLMIRNILKVEGIRGYVVSKIV